MLTGMASLEEWIQEKYVEHYDEIDSENSKVLELIGLESTKKYFYKPTLGTLPYIVDSDGYAYFLIDKDRLPKEIRDGLVGGDAGSKTYNDYATLNDVYGVTSNLKVYYSFGNGEGLLGIEKENLDLDNPDRVVFKSDNSYASTFSKYDKDGDGQISAKEIKSITKIDVGESGITDLTDVYQLTSLKEIKISNSNLENLNGIENAVYLKKLTIEVSSIEDASKLSNAKNLEILYITNTGNGTIQNVLTAISNVECPLTDLRIWNNPTLQDLSILSSFKGSTKAKIGTLDLQANNLLSISSLVDFSNVKSLNVNNNRYLSTLNGVQNMKTLEKLYAVNCNLGLNEVYDETLNDNGKNPTTDSLAALSGISTITDLQLNANANLRWCGYVNKNNFTTVYLNACPLLVGSDITLIKEKYNAADFKNIDDGLKKYLSTSDKLLHGHSDLKDTSSEITTMSNLPATEKANVKIIDLSGNPELTNGTLVNLLSSGFSGCKSLRLKGLSLLTSLDYLQYMPVLEEIDIRDTAIANSVATASEMSKIDTYGTKLVSLYTTSEFFEITQIEDYLKRACVLRSATYFISTYNYIWIPSKYVPDVGQITFSVVDPIEFRLFFPGVSANTSKVLDLSGSTFTRMTLDSTYKAKLPASFEVFNDIQSLVYCDISMCNNLRSLSFNPGHGTATNVENYLKQIYDNKFTNFETFCLTRWFSAGQNFDGNFGTMFDYLKYSGVKEITIGKYRTDTTELSYHPFSATFNFNDDPETEKVEFHRLNKVDLSYFNELDTSGFTDANTLTMLSLRYCDLQSVEDFSGLTNLTTLNLSNNSISDISDLSGLTNLTSIDLSNNALDDSAIDVLNQLIENGHLQTVNISGNAGIIHPENLKTK